MRYERIWKKTLNDNEKVEHEFSVAPRYRKLFLIGWSIFGLICLPGTPVAGIIFILLGMLNYWYLGLDAYAFTSKRILIHSGWLSTQSTSIVYDKIVEVSIKESFLDRTISHSGSLIIKTAGFGHDVLLKNIETPYEAKKILDRLSHPHS